MFSLIVAYAGMPNVVASIGSRAERFDGGVSDAHNENTRTATYPIQLAAEAGKTLIKRRLKTLH